VPLAILPLWAQRVAGFMPGRYAVDVLQRCFTDPQGLIGAGFSLIALVVIGAAAGVAGTKLFRWDAGRRINRSALGWVAVALLAWLAVGLTAAATGHLQPVDANVAADESITDEQAESITYEDLPSDNEIVSRLAPPFLTSGEAPFVDEFSAKLAAWPPGRNPSPVQNVLNLVSVAAIADVSEDIHEGEIARIVFDQLQTRHKHTELRRILAWVILNPREGKVINQATELGLRRHPPDSVVRERIALYARKYLGRLMGKIHD
jgi:ABC-2 type transport system permease protein